MVRLISACRSGRDELRPALLTLEWAMKLVVFLVASFAVFHVCIPMGLAFHDNTFLVSKLPETCKIELGDIPPDESAELSIQIKNDTRQQFTLTRIAKVCGCVQITNTSDSSIAHRESLTIKIKLIRQNADETEFQRRITLVSSQGDFAIDLFGTFRRHVEMTPSNVNLSGKPEAFQVSIRTYPEKLREALTFQSVSNGVEVSETTSGSGQLLLTIKPDQLQSNGITQGVFIDSYENGVHRQRLTLTVVETTAITVRPEKPTFVIGPETCSLKLFIAGVDLTHSDDLTVQILEPNKRVLRFRPTIQIQRVSDRLCIVGVECREFDLRTFSELLLSLTSESIGLNLEVPCRLPENLNDSRK